MKKIFGMVWAVMAVCACLAFASCESTPEDVNGFTYVCSSVTVSYDESQVSESQQTAMAMAANVGASYVRGQYLKHSVQFTDGSFIWTDADGAEYDKGDYVQDGTQLTLTGAEKNYQFVLDGKKCTYVLDAVYDANGDLMFGNFEFTLHFERQA